MSAERGSLCVRLTFWYSLSSFALILAATGYLYWAFARNLDRENDGALMDQIHILRVLLRERPDDSAGIRQEVEIESGAREHSKMYVRILDSEGRIVAETPGMAGRLPVDVFPVSPEGTEGVARSAGKDSFRVMTSRAALGARDSARVLQVALDRGEEDRLLAHFRSRLVPLLAVSLLFCSIAGYQIARRGMRPIERISETAGRIRSVTLHERIPAREFPTELGELATTFNSMLDRLQGSFERLSQFSADIAHELRTPLNSLRSGMEVALGKVRSPEEYMETLTSALEETVRLSQLVDNLLFLARADHPETQIHRESLDLGCVLGGVVEFYEAAAAESGVAIDLNVAGPVPAELDRTLMQRAVLNMVENALAHTGRGGKVTLAATRQDGRVSIEVSDTGCGIAPEHLQRAFDRLYRVDRSRTAATGGAGLGLAIVKSIAELHGGIAEISSEVGKGTRVTLLLPSEKTKT